MSAKLVFLLILYKTQLIKKDTEKKCNTKAMNEVHNPLGLS